MGCCKCQNKMLWSQNLHTFYRWLVVFALILAIPGAGALTPAAAPASPPSSSSGGCLSTFIEHLTLRLFSRKPVHVIQILSHVGMWPLSAISADCSDLHYRQNCEILSTLCLYKEVCTQSIQIAVRSLCNYTTHFTSLSLFLKQSYPSSLVLASFYERDPIRIPLQSLE